MISAKEALYRLKEGNARYTAGRPDMLTRTSQTRRGKLVAGQQPFAVVLGCSDSRVPAEIIFDQGLGDLFVIRVAGNIAGPSQIGSVEFGVEKLGARLVVVLGHTACGAVLGTLEAIGSPMEDVSTDLRSIIGRIRPSVEPLLEADTRLDTPAVVSEAVQANIRASVEHLRNRSFVLKRQVESGSLHIVGAEYSLESGLVKFFEEK